MSAIASNLQAVRDAIAGAARAVLRAPESVTLLAVSKSFGPGAVLEAARAGQTRFGENYVQEALAKIEAVRALQAALPEGDPGKAPLEWHFIGPIQSNKTRAIAAHFDWVHSVERIEIARRLSSQRPAALGPLNVCVQCNISGEASKSGAPLDGAHALLDAVGALPRLRLRGLMAIPAPEADHQRQCRAYERLHNLYLALRDAGLQLDTLSIGMSGDLAAAIASGATVVRVGSAIFGAREYRKG